MNSYTLKPFGNGNYLSEKEFLKAIEKIPIPPDDAPAVKPAVPATPAPAASPVIDLDGRLIDLTPADNSSEKTQGDWIAYFNGQNKMMVSAPDIYLAGKSGNKRLLTSLRKDFKERWIVTSTRIKYDQNLDARIIHNYGSNLVHPVEQQVIIPEYQPKLLADVLNTPEGLRYLQVLFGTDDTAQGIKETLHKLSGYDLDKTKVWSVALSDRPIERAAGFNYYIGNFHVIGDIYIGDRGRSRGVGVSSAKRTR